MASAGAIAGRCLIAGGDENHLARWRGFGKMRCDSPVDVGSRGCIVVRRGEGRGGDAGDCLSLVMLELLLQWYTLE